MGTAKADIRLVARDFVFEVIEKNMKNYTFILIVFMILGACTSERYYMRWGEDVLTSRTQERPPSGLAASIFSSSSNLTEEQWEKINKVLEYINADCMGGRLLGPLLGPLVRIVHDPNSIKNGVFDRDTRTIFIKDFDDIAKLEVTLVHELIHAAQADQMPKLNQEVEAHLAIYRYALRNGRRGLSINSDKYHRIWFLNESMNEKFQVIDFDLYVDGYEKMIEDLRRYGYQDFPEDVLYRNFNTMKALSTDC